MKLICPHCGKEIVPWVFELKATYQSSTKAIEENPHWLRQLLSQCHAVESNVAVLSRLELMGNWKWVYHPSKPETIAKLVQEFGENWAAHPTLGAWKIEFSALEIYRNWEWMKVRKYDFEKILETKSLLPPKIAVPKGQEWECSFCSYRGTECEGIEDAKGSK